MNGHQHELHAPLHNKTVANKRVGRHQRRNDQVGLDAPNILKLTMKVWLLNDANTIKSLKFSRMKFLVDIGAAAFDYISPGTVEKACKRQLHHGVGSQKDLFTFKKLSLVTDLLPRSFFTIPKIDRDPEFAGKILPEGSSTIRTERKE